MWKACGRRGTAADFLKGLIKLAAAGVKKREGRPEGVRRHGARAEELFRGVTAATGGGRYCGLDLGKLVDFAAGLRGHDVPAPIGNAAVEIVLDLRLIPVAR